MVVKFSPSGCPLKLHKISSIEVFHIIVLTKAWPDFFVKHWDIFPMKNYKMSKCTYKNAHLLTKETLVSTLSSKIIVHLAVFFYWVYLFSLSTLNHLLHHWHYFGIQWITCCFNNDSSLYINKLLSFKEDKLLVIHTQVSFLNAAWFVEPGKIRGKKEILMKLMKTMENQTNSGLFSLDRKKFIFCSINVQSCTFEVYWENEI